MDVCVRWMEIQEGQGCVMCVRLEVWELSAQGGARAGNR